MTTVLRTPSASYNALSGNSDLYTATGSFDITLPSDYMFGTPITFDVVGGCVVDGSDAPTSFSYHCEVSLWNVDGGSALTATLDAGGYGFAIGSTIAYLNTITGSTLTTAAVDQALLSSSFTAPLNVVTGTLQDGSAVGYSGEGFTEQGGFTHYHGPVGWSPGLETGFTTTSTDPFSADQVITAGVSLVIDVEDSVNPDRAIYGVIQSITVTIGAHVQTIDIATLSVGWSTGVTYTAVNKPGGSVSTFPVQTNPRRTVDSTDPVNFPNLQQQSDLYLGTLDGGGGGGDPDPTFNDGARLDVLLRVEADPVIRIWSGLVRDLAIPAGGPETTEGAIYQAFGQLTGLPELAAALNGEAQRLDFGISGVAVTSAVAALAAGAAGDIRGVKVDVGLVIFDSDWQLVPPVYWVWSGTADSLTIDRSGDATSPVRALRLSAGNVFTGRRRPNPIFYADIDQKRRSADDDFCDEVSKLSEGSTKVWGVG